MYHSFVTGRTLGQALRLIFRWAVSGKAMDVLPFHDKRAWFVETFSIEIFIRKTVSVNYKSTHILIKKEIINLV
jgi:hypothetical protein